MPQYSPAAYSEALGNNQDNHHFRTQIFVTTPGSSALASGSPSSIRGQTNDDPVKISKLQVRRQQTRPGRRRTQSSKETPGIDIAAKLTESKILLQQFEAYSSSLLEERRLLEQLVAGLMQENKVLKAMGGLQGCVDSCGKATTKSPKYPSGNMVENMNGMLVPWTFDDSSEATASQSNSWNNSFQSPAPYNGLPGSDWWSNSNLDDGHDPALR